MKKGLSRLGFLIVVWTALPLEAQTERWWPHPIGGEGDQAGGSNWITPKRILEAVHLVKSDKVYELGHLYERGMPIFGDRTYELFILRSRRVEKVIGDDWIINDGGETTIVVNDVKLHDGAMGSTGLTASNGAWDVMVRDDGVTVDTSTNPWTLSARSTSIIADRDFSVEDFNEDRSTRSPEPEPEPKPKPEPEPKEFTSLMEVYAPRAALYEAVPDFLLRLMGPARNCLLLPGPPESPSWPVWVQLSGGKVAYEAVRSSVGTEYGLERRTVDVGINVPLGGIDGWLSVRRVLGSADVSAPTGSGEIEATGTASSVGVSWRGRSNFYAVGCGSLTDYNINFSSNRRGLLKESVDGDGYSLGAELGRRFDLGRNRNISLTPRAWLVRTSVAVDNFTDAVNSRVSFPHAHRLIGGLGAVAEARARLGRGGQLSLRSSVDIERTFRGTETVAWVSAERLSTESPEDGILLGLDGVYRKSHFSVGAKVTAWTALAALGSNNRGYSSIIKFGLHF